MDVLVNIGRNVGNVPMTPRKWAEYRDDLEYLIGRFSTEVHTITQGRGEWAGSGEDSFSVVFTIHPDIVRVDALKEHLGAIAATYDQEAIAWLSGQTELLRP